ncbi:MAG: hypothetical protein ABL962_17845 [Fimbriimonadaceae bacterium]
MDLLKMAAHILIGGCIYFFVLGLVVMWPVYIVNKCSGSYESEASILGSLISMFLLLVGVAV